MNQIRISTLSNGLRVVTRDMPGLHSAAIGIWVSAGGRDERAEQNGIAHFLEHMAFKGTATRSALDIVEAIENVGGYINAYTSRDVTSYYVRVLAGDVGMALDVISDIVLNPVFDAREIEVERGVILQEIGQSLDTPDDVIFDWLQEAAYPDQPTVPVLEDVSVHVKAGETLAVLGRGAIGDALAVAALLGLFLRVEVIEVAEEFVEAMHRGQVLITVAEVVLTEVAGRVAGALEHFGQARRGRLQAERVARLADGGHPRTDRVLAGDEGSAAGGRARLGVVVGEADALQADAVDGRGGVAHRAHAVGADVLPADVVAPDDQDVGLFAGRDGGGGQAASH